MGHQVQKIHSGNHRFPINLLYITYSKFDDIDWHSTPHSHHFTELFYIKNGSGHFLIDNQKISVRKNDLIIINPNVEHTEVSSKENSLEYIALAFEGFTFTFPSEEKYQHHAHLQIEKNNYCESILDKMLEEINQKKKNYEMFCQNLLEILIVKIIREGDYKIKESDTKKINSSIFSAKTYIDNNFKQEITLDTLADISHMNKYYLAHSFKESFGISPIEYLNNIRINEAKTLLETTDYSIAEISDVIGFSSQSYFSQFFRTKLKETPSLYRKKRKQRT